VRLFKRKKRKSPSTVLKGNVVYLEGYYLVAAVYKIRDGKMHIVDVAITSAPVPVRHPAIFIQHKYLLKQGRRYL